MCKYQKRPVVWQKRPVGKGFGEAKEAYYYYLTKDRSAEHWARSCKCQKETCCMSKRDLLYVKKRPAVCQKETCGMAKEAYSLTKDMNADLIICVLTCVLIWQKRPIT